MHQQSEATPTRRRRSTRTRWLFAGSLIGGLFAFGYQPAGANAEDCGPAGSPAGRIGNAVFLDANDDGVFDDGETGIDGVTVALWEDTDDDGVFDPDNDTELCSTTTSGGGQYWFHNVNIGPNYFVVVPDAPAGTAPSSVVDPDPATDNVNDGAPVGDYASVSGLIDFSASGTQPTDETSPAGDDDEDIADGETGPWSDTDSNLTIDFGFATLPPNPPCLGIGNRVWNDENDNGILDPGEVGINGVTVQLFAADGSGNATGSALDSVVTSDGGYYLFSCLDEGDYVVVIPASNFASGGPLEGTVSSEDTAHPAGADSRDRGIDPVSPGNAVHSHAITLTEGGQPINEADKPGSTAWDFDDPSDDSVTTLVDFGFTDADPSSGALGSLGDFVWFDANGNGIQDPGETPVADVEMILADADDGGAILGTTTTDANGFYTFVGLPAGNYVVCFNPLTVPVGMVPTTANQGDDDSLDSDFNPQRCTAAISLASGEHNPTIDLGLVSLVDLAITKTGTWSATTGLITWNLTVTNLGTAAEDGTVVVSDTVPLGLGVPTVTAPAGVTCSYNQETRLLSCSTSGLAAGASFTVSFTTTRTATSLCSVNNVAAVGGTAVDANVANNTASATVSGMCATTPPPAGNPPPANLARTGVSTVPMIAAAVAMGLVGWQLVRWSSRALARRQG